MRRRICRAGATLSVLFPMALAVGTAGAAAKAKVPTTTVRCASATTIAAPSGQTYASPTDASGTSWGSDRCTKIGQGIERDAFTVPSSGNVDAKYAMYFAAGSLYGTYILTPLEAGLNFLSSNYTGVLKVTGGTGIYKGVYGTGAMFCKSPDGIHTTCKTVLKLVKLP